MAFCRLSSYAGRHGRRGEGLRMPKVTMSLTDRDAENTEKIRQALQARSNAHAVSIALSLTAFLVEQLQRGNEVLLRTPEGELQKVIMTELAPIRPPLSAAAT